MMNTPLPHQSIQLPRMCLFDISYARSINIDTDFPEILEFFALVKSGVQTPPQTE